MSPFNSSDFTLPYNGQTRMRLTVGSGLAHGLIVVDRDARALIAVEGGDGIRPRLHLDDGEIALTLHTRFGDWLRGLVQPCHRDVAIVLHPAVEWTLAIRGGMARSSMDLSAGSVARIDIDGGCSEVGLELPRPRASVPIRINGGASRLVVHRPAETAVALAASGGIAALRLDDQRFDAIGGAARLETRNATANAPRYELQLRGGAAELEIDRPYARFL